MMVKKTILLCVGVLLVFLNAGPMVTYIYTTSGQGIWFSNNEGAMWTRLPGFNLWTNDLICGKVNGLAPTILYAATIDGVWKRDYDGTWSPAGLQGMNIYEIEKSPEANYMLAVTKHGDIYRTLTPGGRWNLVHDETSGQALAFELRIVRDQPSTVYVSVRTRIGSIIKTAVRKSKDYGHNWSIVGSWSAVWLFNKCTAVHPTNTNVVGIGGYDGYLQSLDGGKEWDGDSRFAVWDAEYKILPNDTTRLIIANADNVCGYDPGVWYSDDYGQTWHASEIIDEIAIKIAVNPDLIYTYAFTKNNGRYYFHKLDLPTLLATHDYPDTGPRRLLVDYFDLSTIPKSKLSDSGEKTTDYGSAIDNTQPIRISYANRKITVNCANLAVSSSYNHIKGRIIDITGRVIREITGIISTNEEIKFEWDLKNNHGVNVNSGVYFFVYEDGKSIVRAKLPIVRR